MRIAFIGGGNMATSLIGALRARGVDASFITVAEPVGALHELRELLELRPLVVRRLQRDLDLD